MSGKPLFTGDGAARALTPAGLDVLEHLASQGKSVREIAPELGLSRDNTVRVIDRQPEARAAWERGKARKRLSPAQLALVHPGRNGRPLAIQTAGLDCIRELASRGVSTRSIASSLGISKKQLEQAIENDPAVAAAYEQGHAAIEQTVVANLLKQSNEGSIAATIFLAKNFCGMSDNGPVGKSAGTNIQIVLPGAMSREQFMRQATVTTEGAANE